MYTQPAESPVEVYADAISAADGSDFRSHRDTARSCSPVFQTPKENVESSAASLSGFGCSTSRRELEDLRQRNILNQLERAGQRSARHVQRSTRQAREALESRIFDDADGVAAGQARAQIVTSRASLAGRGSASTSHSAREEVERSQEFEAAFQAPCPTVRSGREAALRSPRTCAERAERPPPHGDDRAEEADGSCDAEQELLALWRGASDSRKDEVLALWRGVTRTAPPELHAARLFRAKSASRAMIGSSSGQLLRDHWRRAEQTELHRLWARRLGC